jgi:DNA-binding NtrC family response regulator
MKVLVVSDERTTANSLAEVLRRNGHHVLPLYSAIEAVEHAEELAFDVALVVGKLNRSFLELGDYLQKLMPRCRLIFVLDPFIIPFAQGFAERGLMSEFEYLPEPFETEDLLKKLGEIVPQRSLEQKETAFSDSTEHFGQRNP